MKVMLLKQLKYFISIVEKGNFTEAVEENYISQSAISQQIQSLENELGYKLLVACNKGIFPIESMLKQVKSDGTIKTIPLYYKQNQISRKYYAFWKKENESPVISNFANILKEMF